MKEKQIEATDKTYGFPELLFITILEVLDHILETSTLGNL